MASSSRSRVTFGDNGGDDGDNYDDLIARIMADIQNAEGEPAHKNVNQGDDGINEEANIARAGGLKPVSQLAAGKSSIPVISNTQDKSENSQDDKRDEAHNEEQGHDSDVESGSKRDGDAGVKLRKSRRIEVPQTGKVSADVTQQEPNDDAKESTPRKRGRPTKKAAGVDPITDPEASSRLKGNIQQEPNESAQIQTPRKRGRPPKQAVAVEGSSRSSATKRKSNIPVDGSRRSSRPASEFATQKITEQSKRLKIADTQSEAGHKNTTKPARKTPTKKKEYEVDLIVARRKRSGITEYEVKWKGYSSSQNTWEPAANLTHCAQAIDRFNNRHKA